jgi:hypothetical protein
MPDLLRSNSDVPARAFVRNRRGTSVPAPARSGATGLPGAEEDDAPDDPRPDRPGAPEAPDQRAVQARAGAAGPAHHRRRAHRAEPAGAPPPGARHPARDARFRPARAAAERPDRLRHPGQHPQPGLRRAARAPGTHRRDLPRQRAPDEDHREDRLARRPPGRRVEPDGRCAAAGRFARECDHSAARGGRSAGVDPALRRRAAVGAEPDRLQEHHTADDQGAGEPGTGQGQHPDLGRHRQRQDHAAQPDLRFHSRQRAHRDHRGCGRAAAAPAARGAPGDAAAEHRGQGRGDAARPGAQLAAHAPRPHHPGRGARGRSARHAAGDEHRPRRIAGDDPREHAARRPVAPREHGQHGRRQPDDARDPPADLLGHHRDPAGLAPRRRHPQGGQHPGGHGHGRRHHLDAGDLPLRADRHRCGRQGARAISAPPAYGRASPSASRPSAPRCRKIPSIRTVSSPRRQPPRSLAWTSFSTVSSSSCSPP